LERRGKEGQGRGRKKGKMGSKERGREK